MLCEVIVTPAGQTSLAFLASHCPSAQEAIELKICADILSGVLQYDPAQQGLNYARKPNRRVLHRGPLSVHYDLLFKNAKWIVEIVGYGRNPRWVR
jgi:hypothetical protein